MIIRILKYKLKSKEFKTLCFFSLAIYLCLFLVIKNEFYYNAIQYNVSYLNYYINRYLNGNINDIIFNNSIYMYVESDVQNIFSSLYLYVASLNNNIFITFMILITIMVFHHSISNFHCDIFNKFSITKITRIGRRKYIKNEIISNFIYSGLLFFIPRLSYFMILSCFFPVGISSNHFLTSVSFISEKFFYLGYSCSPVIIIILDLIMTFMYGSTLSLISILISICVKNRGLSYMIYIFIMITLSFVPWYFYKAPFLFYSSIFQYFSFFYESAKELNVYEPIVIIFVFNFILCIITKVILRKKVDDNI